jgi:hypothetical protein
MHMVIIIIYKMDKLKDLWNENTKKIAVPAAAITLSLLGGTYAYKKIISGNPEFGGIDAHFVQ